MPATRRTVLQMGAAGGAALLLGVRWSGDAFAVEKKTAGFAPNVWVRIEPSGKTILTVGKSEMGQGVRTSLPMILADELDADWEQVELTQASPSAKLRVGTGGSWSIGGSWRPLRVAGAAAREMLVAAAAAQWKVNAAECTTEKGTVIHAASGRKLGYGALVAAAAKLPVPEKPALKPVASLRIVGKGMKRLDGPEIVAGVAQYGIDVKVPGMLYASVERRPTPTARPARVDDAAARKVKGVKKVVTIPRGVAVVADSTWAAMQGRGALKIDWDPGAAAGFNSVDHWKALEAAAGSPGWVTRREGAWPAGGKEITARYHYAFAAHAAVEPMNCVAHVKRGKCEIWAPTQNANEIQAVAAEMLGLEPEAVTVHVTLMGGGFGRRLNVDYAREAVNISRQVGAPVQVVWTRVDDMRHGHFQAASVHDLAAVIDGGKVVAWRHKKVSSPHNLDGPPTAEELADPPALGRGLSWGVYDVPYGFPAIDTAYVMHEAPVPIGPWRAVFSPSSTFARECFVDELAQALGQDPLALRLAWLGGPGVADTVKAGDLQIDRRRLRRVLQLATEKAGWGTPLPPGRARGLACNVYDGETHVAYVVEVSASKERAAGRLPFQVHRVVCAVDCGVVINPLGVEQQVESGVVWGLSNMKGEITFRDGGAVETSYREFPVLRMSETPVIETHIVPSHGEQPFGMGEPTVPPLAPAVANALAAATGKRIRRLPVKGDWMGG